MKEIYLAGGCFWGVQAYFQHIPGVIKTTVGYANGPHKIPTYQEVCKVCGHAETVHIIYDSNRLSLECLLAYYYDIVDPVSINRQGNDIGIQYRTGIYYIDHEDAPIIEKSLHKLQAKYKQKIQIECVPLKNFYPAEEYHQNYLTKHPQGYCHIPKEKLQKQKRKPGLSLDRL